MGSRLFAWLTNCNWNWPLCLAYFIVHDIFIHQRFKIFRNIDNKYARGIRRAHKIHHKNIKKDGGECFGMLIVPMKYFK